MQVFYVCKVDPITGDVKRVFTIKVFSVTEAINIIRESFDDDFYNSCIIVYEKTGQAVALKESYTQEVLFA